MWNNPCELCRGSLKRIDNLWAEEPRHFPKPSSRLPYKQKEYPGLVGPLYASFLKNSRLRNKRNLCSITEFLPE
jgi:hypothetical protein